MDRKTNAAHTPVREVAIPAIRLEIAGYVATRQPVIIPVPATADKKDRILVEVARLSQGG